MGLIRKSKEERKAKLKEKLDMYDMIIANMIAGNSLIEPTKTLQDTEVAIGFSNISSSTYISKIFVIRNFPDYIVDRLIDDMRANCLTPGVKMNFYFYAEPYKINWDSPEMRSRLRIWKQWSEENNGEIGVFEYRDKRDDKLLKERLVQSTQYLNEAELECRRSLTRVSFVIKISTIRDDIHILNMSECIMKMKRYCANMDIKVRELRVNLIDWLRGIGVFSLNPSKEIENKLSKKVLTDDLLASMTSFKQGRVGETGVLLGVDVLSNFPVLRKFKRNPDGAENWLICAETGGGKSYFIKSLLTYLLADNFVVTIMDYEGDEYLNFAAYIKNGNTEDVKIVSMGGESLGYFDPMKIPDLTGDNDIDKDLKSTAISYALAMFRIIVCGIDGELTRKEEKIISEAIGRVYDSAGVTDDRSTWKRSRNLRLSMIHTEIKEMVRKREFIDGFDNENEMHKSAVNILDASSIYFEENGAKYNIFRNPLSADELFKSKLIVFSFGMKGADSSLNDATTLSLKQLSVACISTQISNHCKYVRKCFNVKLWEEFQRWGQAKGSASIITNAITGGRKRGDVNFIITNNLVEILDEQNPIMQNITQNLQNFAIGKIKDKDIIHKFCKKFSIPEIEGELYKIHKASTSSSKDLAGNGVLSRYQYAFCLVLDTGEKPTVKVRLPKSLEKSDLFKTGIKR